MFSFRAALSKLRAVLATPRLDTEMNDELRFHIEMETEANMKRGMSREEAHCAAIRQFGGVAQTAEACRERRGIPFIETLLQDVRYALRLFRRFPGFTAVAVLSLALGIGANTAIFTLIDQVLIRALPVQNPAELVRFDAPGKLVGMQQNFPHTIPYPVFQRLGSQSSVFSGVLAHYLTGVNMSAGGTTERVSCDLVSGSYFRVLGLRPTYGRLLTEDDDRKPGAHPVAVLSYGFWERRFGSDPSIIGRTVRLNKSPMTIVGVAPQGFRGISADNYVDILVPLMMKAQMVPWWPQLDSPREAWLDVFARRAQGVSLEQAQAAMDVFYRSYLNEDVRTLTGVPENVRREFLAGRLVVQPGLRGTSNLQQIFASPLKALMAMVGIVLLIACANLAGLLIARAAARQTEFGIRIALGAGRGRLFRQLMTESLLLACAGGVAGLAVALVSIRGLIALLPFKQMARGLEYMPDLNALAFTMGVSILAALVFGLVPALQTTRPAVWPSLKGEVRASSGMGAARLRRASVALQVALSLVLVVGAGLFARTLYNLKASDYGLERERIVLVDIDPTLNGYTSSRIRSLVDDINRRLKAIPGVRAVGFTGFGPINATNNYNTLRMEGHDEPATVNTVNIGPGTLLAMGLRMRSGREFTTFDERSSRDGVVITESLARRWFGGAAVGKRLGSYNNPWPTTPIIGVVEDIAPPEPRGRRDYVFYSTRGMRFAMFHILTALPPETLSGPIRDAVRSADPNLPVGDLNTMAAVADQALFTERMLALLSTCFGGLALLLAAFGIYGVTAWSVVRRKREIGIRLALGAGALRILSLVITEVLWMLGAGLVLAAPAIIVLFGLVRAQLYGVEPGDPLTITAATALLVVIALAAGLLPGCRALRVSASDALHSE